MLPPIPRPPHDPLSLTLDASRGFRAALRDHVSVDPGDGGLTLAVSSGARTLAEPSGSFGGLVPPALAAVNEAGDVFLLDAATALLKKFDECACSFIDVPHIGGSGSGARQFTLPAGIAIARGNLFVADTGNRRVSVFALRGYVLRGTLNPPASEVPLPWSPIAVAADHRGRVYVADPSNGCVHRFGAHGAWESAIRSVGAVIHLAVDCRGWLYVVTMTSPDARVFDGHGTEQTPATSVAAIKGRFAPLSLRVAKDGALDFSQTGSPCLAAFDLHGAPLAGVAVPDTVQFESDGTFRSVALDSGIADCQWHRVVLCGAMPAGTTITVLTRSSEVAESDELVDLLPDDAWDGWQVARRASGSDGRDVRWDSLVRSGPGRFLWLRLRLRGDGKVAPKLCHVTLEMPRISLARWLPGVFSGDRVAGDFTDRFLSIFDTTIRSIERQLDDQAALFDPRSTPAQPGGRGAPDFLSWLATWVGISLDRHWPEARRRRFLREAPRLFDHRGTAKGLRAVLLLYLGLADTPSRVPGRRTAHNCVHPNRCSPLKDPCAEPEPSTTQCAPALVLEHWRLRRWMFVGMARLGEESMLWGRGIVNRSRLGDGAQTDVTRLIASQDPYRDPFHVYASTFTVFVPACFARDATARKGLENLLRDESPAHTRWHLELVEPRFRIGVQSMIGYDSVVGHYPEANVTVGTSTLGRATVLGGVADDAAGPSMRVGSAARIGSTTMLK